MNAIPTPDARIRLQMDRVLHLCREQIEFGMAIADCRPDIPPFDLEPYRVAIYRLREARQLFDAGDPRGCQQIVAAIVALLEEPASC